MTKPSRDIPYFLLTPSRRLQAFTLAAAVGLLISAPPLAAPDSPPAEAPVFEGEVGVSWVLVPVAVRSPRGYVTDLARRDFRLSVDGLRVGIETFDPRSGEPMSLLVLQDLSGSIGNHGKLETSRRTVRLLLDRARPGDEFSIATFAGGRTRVESPFTSDIDRLRRCVTGWQPYGTTGLHDAIAWAPELAAAGNRAKQATVLLTDGADTSSTLGAGEARELVARSEQPIYVFDLGADPDAATGTREGLQLLARVSGGRYWSVPDPETGALALAEMEEQLQHQYLLGFRAAVDSPVEIREIHVELPKKRRLRVTFRHSYRGGEPTAAKP